MARDGAGRERHRILTSKRKRGDDDVQARLKPRGALWLGTGLILFGLVTEQLLLLGVAQQQSGEQQQAVIDAVVFASSLVSGIVVPLGHAFVGFAVLGQALRGVGRRAVNDGGEDDQIDRMLTPGRVLVLGVLLTAAGFALSLVHNDWAQAASARGGILRDVVFTVVPVLRTVLLPLGILLIPGAWLLRLLTSDSVSKLANSRVD